MNKYIEGASCDECVNCGKVSYLCNCYQEEELPDLTDMPEEPKSTNE